MICNEINCQMIHITTDCVFQEKKEIIMNMIYMMK